MTSATQHVADTLLRFLESRRRRESGPMGATSAIPAKQREVRFSDFEGVARLKERGGLAKDTEENWRRLWRQNPAMEVAGSQVGMGWVLETAEGIVGYLGSVPMLYRFGERTLVAASGVGLVIDPAYRTRCIGLLASFFRQPNVDLVVVTHTSASIVDQSKALRAKGLPQPDYDKVLFWILDARKFSQTLATKLGLGSGMGAAGAVLASSALRMDALRRGPRGRLAGSSAVTDISVQDIGDDFEDLWRRKLAEGRRLLADRSPASLKWHFTLPGSSSTVAVIRCHRSGRLAGYAIVLHATHAVDRETGLRRSILADILVEQDDPVVTETLLEAAYANAVASGSHLFEVVGLPADVRRILMGWNPYVRTYPTDPLIYRTTDEELARAIADENAWYAGPFDGDATLLP